MTIGALLAICRCLFIVQSGRPSAPAAQPGACWPPFPGARTPRIYPSMRCIAGRRRSSMPQNGRRNPRAHTAGISTVPRDDLVLASFAPVPGYPAGLGELVAKSVLTRMEIFLPGPSSSGGVTRRCSCLSTMTPSRQGDETRVTSEPGIRARTECPRPLHPRPPHTHRGQSASAIPGPGTAAVSRRLPPTGQSP